MRFLITIFFLFHWLMLTGQPVSDFSIPSTLCLTQNIRLVNTSLSSTEYFWDFCVGDLAQQPVGSLLTNSFGGFGIRVEIKEKDNQFFGFIVSGGTKHLYKLSFGSKITNNPTLVDLGDIGLNSNQLRAIRIVEESDIFFGFIVDSQLNKLYRIDFGNSLDNPPQNAVEIFSGSPLNTPFQIASAVDGSLKYLFISNQGDGKMVRLKFDNSYLNPVSESYQIAVTGNWINGISFIKDNSRWYAVTASPFLSEVQKLDFVNGLDDNVPIATSISIPSNPMGIEIVNENGNYYVFAQTRNPTLSIYRLDFGSSMNNAPIISDINNIGYGAAEVWNISIYNSGTSWVGFATEATGQNIFKFTFPNSCFSNTEYSYEFEPEIVMVNPGTFSVALTASDPSMGMSTQLQTTTVTGNTAPDIAFTSQNICANHDINFTSQNTSGNVTDYNWDFGDTNTSMLANPTHQYATAGDYAVSLQVTATNGCNNLARDTITIYNQPIANFDLPNTGPSPICTNQEYLFANTSTFDPGSNPTWQWEVNGSLVSSDVDLSYTIPSAVMQDVKLIAAIPGCETELMQTINTVEVGPSPDFTFNNDCEDTSILFTNTTAGATTGFSWDFGDGNSSLQTDPSNTFVDFGSYDVTLEATNAAGCINSIVKPIQIYSKPLTDFSIDLPPFSCNGTPSQFNDLTPSPTDSNLSGWAWNFGDPQNGTSAMRHAQYVYQQAGMYDVELEVTTNFGCTEIVQKQVTILQAPQVDFDFDPACVGKSTQFADLSENGVTAWQWNINGTNYSTQNPNYTFPAATAYNASLTVTGTNNCIATLVKSVNVPAPPTLDFLVENNCATLATLFTDNTQYGLDQPVAHDWQFETASMASGSTAEHTYSTPGSFPAQLTVTNQSGCIYNLTKNVQIVNPPIADFMLNPQEGGPPLQVNATNQSLNTVSQIWTVNDPNGTNSSQISPSFTFNELGNFTVNLTVFNTAGCSDSSDKLVSVINPSLDVVLTELTLIQSAANEVSVLISLKNESNFSVSNLNAIIDVGGEALLNEIIPAVIAPGATYTQALKTIIIGTKSALNFVCVEIDLEGDSRPGNNKRCENLNSEIVVFDPYPNPSTTEINLDWIATQSGTADIFIFNSNGQLVFENSISSFQPGLNNLSIQLPILNAGVYYIQFASGNSRSSYQFVVQN